MGFLKSFSEQIHFFVKDNFTDSLILPFQIGLKMLLLFAFFFVIDILLRVTITLISRIFVRISNNEFLKFAYKAKVQNSIAHLFSLAFCFWLIDDIFWRHPKSFTFFERLLMFGQVLVFAMLAYRIVKTFEAYYIHKEDRYRITAIKAISESLRIFGMVIFAIIGIFVIFGISLNTVITFLGAITAVILLVFRDTILGFVTGIHVSTSKNLKIGDWIETTKFEGTVEDITFRSTRIRTFENSIVTIPNSTITNDALINWSKMKKRRYKENFELELSTPLKKVCDIENEIIKMLEEHPRILNDNIMVRFDKVTENGYNLLVYVYTDALNLADYLATSENINFKIMDILNKQRVELAYPSKTIYLKK